MRMNGKLPGAGSDANDPTGTIYIPASALIAAGQLTAERLADGESQAVLARHQVEREGAVDHDELVTLRAEKAMLHRENQLLRDQLRHAQKLVSNIVAGFGKSRAA
jgi:cell division protein FtsB